MATTQLQALKQRGNHEVGNLNNIKIKTVAYGAIVEGGDIDNFTLGELDFRADGERTVKQLSDATKQAYLVASPEARFMGEGLRDFFNAKGERARIVILEPHYTRFDTSAFTLNKGVTAVKAKQVAHFDPATKKFVISEASAPAEAYKTAHAQFVVVNLEGEMEYVDGKECVRLEVTKA